MIETGDEVDLTKVPPAKLAKNAVYILAVQRLKQLLEMYPATMEEFLKTHSQFLPSLGHRRLSRLYKAMADGKDPLRDLEEADEVQTHD